MKKLPIKIEPPKEVFINEIPEGELNVDKEALQQARSSAPSGQMHE